MDQQTHQELMARRGNPDTSVINPDCPGACFPVYSSGAWTLYRCQNCRAEIAAYGGQPDPQNYVMKGRQS